MAKWASISKIAKTAGKSVEEMTEILKNTGHNISKSGKSVLGHVSDLAYMDAPRTARVTEDAIKNARKTKVTKNKDLEDIVLKQGEKFKHNINMSREKDLLIPKPNEETKEFLQGWRKNVEDRINKNRLNDLRETLLEGKANNSVFSKMTDEQFAKQQSKVDKVIEKRRKKGYYSPSSTPKATKVNSEQQELLKERLKNKYSDDDIAVFRSKQHQKKREKEGFNHNNYVYKMAAAGVGGGLVLSMANNRGQQSNAQLYGQGGY